MQNKYTITGRIPSKPRMQYLAPALFRNAKRKVNKMYEDLLKEAKAVYAHYRHAQDKYRSSARDVTDVMEIKRNVFNILLDYATDIYPTVDKWHIMTIRSEQACTEEYCAQNDIPLPDTVKVPAKLVIDLIEYKNKSREKAFTDHYKKMAQESIFRAFDVSEQLKNKQESPLNDGDTDMNGVTPWISLDESGPLTINTTFTPSTEVTANANMYFGSLPKGRFKYSDEDAWRIVYNWKTIPFSGNAVESLAVSWDDIYSDSSDKPDPEEDTDPFTDPEHSWRMLL